MFRSIAIVLLLASACLATVKYGGYGYGGGFGYGGPGYGYGGGLGYGYGSGLGYGYGGYGGKNLIERYIEIKSFEA